MECEDPSQGWMWAVGAWDASIVCLSAGFFAGECQIRLGLRRGRGGGGAGLIHPMLS